MGLCLIVKIPSLEDPPEVQLLCHYENPPGVQLLCHYSVLVSPQFMSVTTTTICTGTLFMY